MHPTPPYRVPRVLLVARGPVPGPQLARLDARIHILGLFPKRNPDPVTVPATCGTLGTCLHALILSHHGRRTSKIYCRKPPGTRHVSDCRRYRHNRSPTTTGAGTLSSTRASKVTLRHHLADTTRAAQRATQQSSTYLYLARRPRPNPTPPQP